MILRNRPMARGEQLALVTTGLRPIGNIGMLECRRSRLAGMEGWVQSMKTMKVLFFLPNIPFFHYSIGNAWSESQQKTPIDFRKPKNFEV